MKRGEIWAACGGRDCAGKPRPAVIVQDDQFEEDVNSVTICFCASNIAGPQIVRPEVAPSEINNLKVPTRLMADKITTLPKSKLGYRVGRLAGEDITRLNRAMMLVLGMAASRSKLR